ncbi:MAG: hypothetical protein GY823_07295 [Flavobacteriaceae bacterium]|nr:hypothetical protein [Flavobacteriaceae bacterium]
MESNNFINFFNQKNNLHFDESEDFREGLWICSSKFRLLEDEIISDDFVRIPNNSFIFSKGNVFRLNKDNLREIELD